MGKGVSGGGNMNCGEFQESLAYIIDTGGNAKQKEHLKECSVCSDLVSDLRYIADQAKLLVPMLEPSSRVWDGIKTSLEQEGVVKNRTARGRLLGILPASRWGPGTRGSGIWMLQCPWQKSGPFASFLGGRREGNWQRKRQQARRSGGEE